MLKIFNPPGVALFKLKNPFSEFFRRFFQTDSRCGTSVHFCGASPGPVTRSTCRSFSKVSYCRKHGIIRRLQQLRRFRRQTTGGIFYPYNGFQPFPGIRYALHNVVYMTDSHFSHFDKIPLVIFDFTPRQRKPSIYPGAGSDRIRWKSNTNRPPDGSRSNGTRQKDGLRPSFICFPVQKLPIAGRRLSPCLSLAPHALAACKVFQGSFLSSWQPPFFNFWV